MSKTRSFKQAVQAGDHQSTYAPPLRPGLFFIREDAFPVALLLLLPLFYLGMVLFSGSEILGSPTEDGKSLFFGARLFGFTEVSNLRMPLWNPYVFGGTPFIGTLQSSIFYPFNLIFTVLPIAPAMNWSVALHLALSAIFTYFLVKHYGVSRWGAMIAGMVYTFSAPQVMHIFAGHLNVLSAMAWTPLIFLLADRMIEEGEFRYSLFLGMAIALQFLAGHPQYVFYTLIALAAYLVCKLWPTQSGKYDGRELSWQLILFLVAVFTSLAVSAVQILPTVEMTHHSTRENLSYEWVSQFSFPPSHFITFFIPDFFGNMLHVPYWGNDCLWEMTAYAGIVPLFLAVIAVFRAKNRQVRFFAVLASVSLLFALGKYTPLLHFCHTFIPGFKLFRGSSKFIFLNAFSIAVLSGFGLDFLLRTYERRANRKAGIVVMVATFLIGAFLLVLLLSLDVEWFQSTIRASVSTEEFLGNAELFVGEDFARAAVACFQRGAFIAIGLVVAASLGLLLYLYGFLARKLFISLIIVLVAGDLYFFGSRYMITFDSSNMFWHKDVVEFLAKDQEPFRIAALNGLANAGMVNRIETLGGYDTIMLKRSSELINLSQAQTPSTPILQITIASIGPLTNLLNLKYILVKANANLDSSMVKEVFNNGSSKIYQVLDALPRAFVVHAAKIAPDRESVFEKLTSTDFDPASYVILEEKLEDFPDLPDLRSPRPKIIEYAADRVVIEASLEGPGLLVLADAWYPGWHALVDGQEARIYPANLMMRGVVLPQGKHRVEFSYTPRSFMIGLLLSLAVLIACAVFLIVQRRAKDV